MINKHLVLCTAVLACGSRLGAGTIPAANYTTSALYSNILTDVILSSGGHGIMSASEPGSSATISLDPAAVLSTSVSYLGQYTSESAGAFADYFFEVSGPVAGVSVPVFISFNLSASGAGTGAAIAGLAEINLDPNASTRQNDFVQCLANGICSTKYLTNTSSLHASFYAVLSSGGVHEITLSVNANTSGAGDGSAFGDPYIYVDPNFAGASNYSIVQSAGVGNGLPASTSAAPEPASFALIGVALIGVAVLKRRKLNRA